MLNPAVEAPPRDAAPQVAPAGPAALAGVSAARIESVANRARQLDLQLKSLRESFRESVEDANRRMQGDGRSVDISFDKQVNMLIVRVMDRETGEQIRQVPPQAAVDITRNIDRLTGILVDRKV